MANKTIRGYVVGYDSTSVYAIVRPEGSTTPVNAGGHACTFSGNNFTFTITESVTVGIFDVQLFKVSDDSEYTGLGKVFIQRDDIVGTYTIDSIEELSLYQVPVIYPPVSRSGGDTNAIWIYWPTTGATITGTVIINEGSAVAITGATTQTAVVVDGYYRYSLAYNAADRPTGEGTALYQFTDGTIGRVLTLEVGQNRPSITTSTTIIEAE